MERAHHLAFLVLVVMAQAGCVSVNKSVLDHSFGDRTVPAQQVQVYFADDDIPEHTRVAILNASGDSGFTDEGQMIDRLREEAGKLGANAIVLDELREPGTGERVANALFSGVATGQRRAAAIAIYLDP